MIALPSMSRSPILVYPRSVRSVSYCEAGVSSFQSKNMFFVGVTWTLLISTFLGLK